MKFIVSSGALLKQLQLIGGVINNNNTLPILDNFLFELSNNSLKISASDLETTMTTSLEVQSESEGLAAMPAKILMDTLKTFPEQPLTFVLDQEKSTAEISSDHGNYSVAFVEGDEFPRLPELEDASTTILPGDVLATAVQKTLFAAGNDELRPVMSGVFFQFTPSELTFVATDAHKLVRYRRTDLSSEGTAEFIMPKKPLNLLKASLGTSDHEVKIHYNNTNARFEFDNVVLTCRLIDGKYPNYEAVIPQDNPNKMMIERTSFLGSTKRVSIFSNKSTHQIRLKMAGSDLLISAEDLDFSNKASERLTCEYAGDDLEIGFNSRFLLEMLNNLESDGIRLEMSAPNRAGIILPMDGQEEGEDLLMLVMPVMINS